MYILKFLLLIWVWLEIGAKDNTTVPKNGVILRDDGKLQLIEGILVAVSEVNIIGYVEKNSIGLYQQTRRILEVAKNKKGHFRDNQWRKIERKVEGCSFLFKKLFNHLEPEFLLTNLNISSYALLERNFRQYLNKNDTTETRTRPGLETNLIDDKLRNKRIKRSWIGLGGKILNTVFGTATEDQISALNESLGNVRESLYNIDVRSEHLEGIVSHNINHIKEMITWLQEEERAIVNIRLFAMISDALNEVRYVVQNLVTLAIEAETRHSLLQKGLVPPMLSMTQIKRLIAEGRRTFENLDFPLTNDEDERHKHLKSLSFMTARPTNDPNKFLICVPFVDPKKVYTVKQLSIFPTLQKEQHLVVPEVYKYVAVSGKNFIRFRNMNSCRQFGSLRLCSNTVVKEINTSNCDMGIILDDKSVIANTCKYYEIQLTKGYYALALGKIWYVYFRDDTFATLSCPGKREGKTLKLKGLIKLESPCTITTDEVSLGTVQMIAGGTVDEPVEMIPLMPIDVNIETEIKPKKDLFDKLNNELMSLEHIHVKVPLHKTGWTTRFPIASSSITLSLMVLFFVAAVIFVCLRTKFAELRWNSGLRRTNTIVMHDMKMKHTDAHPTPQNTNEPGADEEEDYEPIYTACVGRRDGGREININVHH